MGNSKNNNFSNNLKKTTGAKLHSRFGSEKGVFITAWNKGKSVKVFRSERQSKNAPTTTKSGKEWVQVTLVLSEAFKEDVIVYPLMNIQNHKVYIQEWNMIINPSAPNGGYFGKHLSKNYN